MPRRDRPIDHGRAPVGLLHGGGHGCVPGVIFDDADGKMNLSLADVGGGLLVVSQFTLWGDCRKGRRPSYIEAAPPEIAEPLYEAFIGAVGAMGIPTATGRFRTDMQVALVNDGPVTLWMDSRKAF